MMTTRIELQVKRYEAAASPRLRNKRKCPVCPETDLVMTERQEVEIDYCPKCRGVWLDRDELDKIVERSVAIPTPSATSNQAAVERDDRHPGSKRRKSWFGNLFD